MIRAKGLLLDTHAAIWLMDGALDETALRVIAEAGDGDSVFVSPITAWEIGLLARPGPSGTARLGFLPDPERWYGRLMALPGVRPAQFDGTIALASSFLPGSFHGDPADRFLVATARSMDVPIFTRDRKILDYAQAGHVRAIAC